MTEYVIKSSVSIALVYLLYYTLARGSSKFKYIRLYFYLAVGASLIFPCFNELPNFFVKENPVIDSGFLTTIIEGQIAGPGEIIDLTNTQMVDNNSPTISISGILTGLYLSGVLFFLIRFLLGLFRIVKMIISNTIVKEKGNRLILIDGLKNSFSFFRLIFLNKLDYISNPDNVMLLHERIHVRQGHSFDNILFEILSVVFWFNPFIWLLRSAIKEIHEYLADEEVLKTHEFSAHEYVSLLLNQATGYQMYMPANNFNGSIIKKRVKMMTTERNKKIYVVILILLVSIAITESLSGFSFLNSYKKEVAGISEEQNTKSNELIIMVLPSQKFHKKDGQGDTIKKQVTNNGPEKEYNIVVTPPFFGGTTNNEESQKALTVYTTNSVTYPKELYNHGTNGMVWIHYSIDEKGKVYNVTCGNESMRNYLKKQIEGKDIPEREEKDKKHLAMILDDPLLIKEAIRVVTSFPPYTPAKNKYGNPVKSEYNACNINFEDPKSKTNNQLFKEYLKANLRYPEEAKSKRIEGTVYLDYDLDKDGRYGNIKVRDMRQFLKEKGDTIRLKQYSENPLLVAEALRLLKERPGFYIENFDPSSKTALGVCSIDFFLPKE